MPFYADSDGLGVRIPALGSQGAPLITGGFVEFGVAVVAAGDDTGNSSATWGAVPDTAPAAATDTDADILVDTQEAFDIFNVEANAAENIWICQLQVQTITAFTASVVIDFGDTTLADGWMRQEEAVVVTTDRGHAATDTADQVDMGIYQENGGKGVVWAASSGHVGATIAGADPAAGRLAVFVQYARVFHAGGA